jgi:hypothetical protein
MKKEDSDELKSNPWKNSFVISHYVNVVTTCCFIQVEKFTKITIKICLIELRESYIPENIVCVSNCRVTFDK